MARRRNNKLDRSRVTRKSNEIYPIRRCGRADSPKPPQTVVARWETQWCCIGEANRRAARSHKRVPGNVRRYSEKTPVVPRRFAFGGTGGWFDRAGSGGRPSSANFRGERAERPFPVPRTFERVPSNVSRSSPPRSDLELGPIGVRYSSPLRVVEEESKRRLG